ncbi:MAG: M42 family peptidase, partial [Acetanaerobacterium sp.]
LTRPVGVSGDETEAAAVAARLLAPYGAVRIDALGNVLCTVNPTAVTPPAEAGEHLLLDAHLDQIGLIVQSIDDKGFIRVANCGGVDRRVVMASDVTVLGREPLFGVVCSSPPHLSADGADKKPPKIEDIAIDVGLSKEQAQRLISPGDRVVLCGGVDTLAGGQIVSQALDDRASCAAVLRCLELIKDKPIACGLSVLFSTREEVGGQGAAAGAFTVNPTEAIVVDVTFAYTPDSPRHKCGEMGAGPMIGIAPTLSRAISTQLCALAREQGIPYQTEVMDGKTGTNADSIVISRSGVASGMVSIPIKYMHTPIETVHPDDVEASARLMAAYILAKGVSANA